LSDRKQTTGSFINEWEFAEYDIETRLLPWLDNNIHSWYEKKELKRHRFLSFMSGHDIEGADGSRPFYEHKADKWYGVKSMNVLIEAYKESKKGPPIKSWLFTSDVDYMIITSAVDIRVYRWNGEYGLQLELIENLDGEYSEFAVRGGDDGVMYCYKIPETKLQRWVVSRGKWDNRTIVDTLVKYRKSIKPVRAVEERPGKIYKYYKHPDNEP